MGCRPPPLRLRRIFAPQAIRGHCDRRWRHSARCLMVSLPPSRRPCHRSLRPLLRRRSSGTMFGPRCMSSIRFWRKAIRRPMHVSRCMRRACGRPSARRAMRWSKRLKAFAMALHGTGLQICACSAGCHCRRPRAGVYGRPSRWRMQKQNAHTWRAFFKACGVTR